MEAYYKHHVFSCGQSLKLKESIKIVMPGILRREHTIEKGSIVEVVALRSDSSHQARYQVHYCSREFDGDIDNIPEYLLESR